MLRADSLPGPSNATTASAVEFIRLYIAALHPTSLPGRRMTYADTAAVYGFVTHKPFSVGVPEEFKVFVEQFKSQQGVGGSGQELDFAGHVS